MSSEISETVGRMTVVEKVDLLSGDGLWRSRAFPRHGVDGVVMTDGTHGVRYSAGQIDGGEGLHIERFSPEAEADGCEKGADGTEAKNPVENMFGPPRSATCFPGGACLACSWDLDLFRRLGRALAEECQEMGVGLLLGPGINIRRTPLAGRGYEYYSEDPVLAGELAAALIRALQGGGVGACLKHFACNNSEFMRMEMDSLVDARPLREIYLAAFRRAVRKGGPWAIMSSYNSLNGVPASQNRWLLTKVLREEWGYDGVVVSDWYGVKNRPASLAAGNDLSMPERKREKGELLAAIESGEVPRECVDASCERVIRLAGRVAAGRRPGTRADYEAHHRLAQEMAAESIVLLKNEGGLLPLTPEKAKSIAVIGLPAQEPVIQGSGCATTVPYVWDIPLDEIYQVAGEDFTVEYAVGAPDGYAVDEVEQNKAVRAARGADAAIVFVSTGIGEDGESGDRRNLDILPAHAELIRAVSAAQPNTAVVLANSDAVVMPWRGSVRAIVETFFAGQGMGAAVARILFGLANPCGRLSVTFPNTLEETPAWLDYPGENYRHRYGEGLFVGYRYYDKRGIEPAFPLGFGLSYTTFTYGSLRLSRTGLEPGDGLDVKVEVVNTGAMAGKEVVQLYLAPPRGRFARERQALKAFAKVALASGETGTVALRLEWDDFAYFDPGADEWVVDPGEYGIRVGTSSRDIVHEEKVTVRCPPRLPRIRPDSAVTLLLENPPVLARVAELVAAKTGSSPERAEKWLARMAPYFFAGLHTTLAETMELDISRRELADTLADQS